MKCSGARVVPIPDRARANAEEKKYIEAWDKYTQRIERERERFRHEY